MAQNRDSRCNRPAEKFKSLEAMRTNLEYYGKHDAGYNTIALTWRKEIRDIITVLIPRIR